MDPGEPIIDVGDVTDELGDNNPGDCIGADPGDGWEDGIDICNPAPGYPPKKLWDGGICRASMFGLISGGESRPAIEFIDICPPPPIPPEVMPDELPTLLSSESERWKKSL